MYRMHRGLSGIGAVACATSVGWQVQGRCRKGQYQAGAKQACNNQEV